MFRKTLIAAIMVAFFLLSFRLEAQDPTAIDPAFKFAGKWKAEEGKFSMVLKIVNGAIEGEASGSGGNRIVKGYIRNFKVEGGKITFEAVYNASRKIGPSETVNSYEMKVIGPSRMEGTSTKDDGSKKNVVIVLEEDKT